MQVKTSELIGAALDWAVAKCEGKAADIEFHVGNLWYGRVSSGFVVWRPSQNWAQGGPIIERERIGVECDDRNVWFASYDLSAETAWGATGLTPLIAAMRCYAASKLGDTVDIPEELL